MLRLSNTARCVQATVRRLVGRLWVRTVVGGVLSINLLIFNPLRAKTPPIEPKRVLSALEAAVRAGDRGEARTWVEQNLPDTEEAMFWKAQAFILLNRDEQAAQLFAKLTEQPAQPFFREAILSEAARQTLRGDLISATKTLERAAASGLPSLEAAAMPRLVEVLLEQDQTTPAETWLAKISPSTQKHLLAAKLELTRDQPRQAIEALNQIVLTEASVTESQKARLLRAQALAALDDRDQAALLWTELIEGAPDSPAALTAMMALVKLSEPPKALLMAKATDWQRAPVVTLHPHGLYLAGHQARQAGNATAASAHWQRLIQEFPHHRLKPMAHYDLAQLALAGRDFSTAIAQAAAARLGFPPGDARAEMVFFTGQTQWAAGDFAAAFDTFADAARAAESASAIAASQANAILAAARAQKESSARGLLKRLQAVQPITHARTLLQLGLLTASTDPEAATRFFENYTANYNDYPASVNARLALAELALAESPPAVLRARQQLLQIQSSPHSRLEHERIDRFKLALDLADQRYEDFLEKSTTYLAEWPESPYLIDVRAQRTRFFFSQEQYDLALREYEAIADATEDAPELLARCHFQTGLTLAQRPDPQALDRAITFWDLAAQADRQIELPARLYQAWAKNRLGDNSPVIQQLNNLLKKLPATETETRSLLLCLLGELWRRPSRQAPVPAEALSHYEAVLRLSPLDPEIRHQALTRSAEMLWLLGRHDAALPRALEATAPLAGDEPRTSFSPIIEKWAIAASNIAFTLLEKKEDWNQLLMLSRRIAKGTSPAAAAAQRRAELIRLEKFMWEPLPHDRPTAGPAPTTPAAPTR